MQFPFGKLRNGKPNEIGTAKMQGQMPKIIPLSNGNDLLCHLAYHQNQGNQLKGNALRCFSLIA
jgi:hypothetical protein